MSVSPSQGHEYIFAFPLLSVSGQSSSPFHSLWRPLMCFKWSVGWVLNVLWGTDKFVPPASYSERPKQRGGRWMLTFQKITHVDRLWAPKGGEIIFHGEEDGISFYTWNHDEGGEAGLNWTSSHVHSNRGRWENNGGKWRKRSPSRKYLKELRLSQNEGESGWEYSLLRLQNQTQTDLTKTHFTVQRCANLQRKWG